MVKQTRKIFSMHIHFGKIIAIIITIIIRIKFFLMLFQLG